MDQRFRLRAASVVVLAAVFGPYLAAGIRLEQVVVYAAAILAVLRFVGARLHPTAVGLAATWACILVVSIVSAASPPHDAEPGSWLAGIDALLLPVATLMLVAALHGSATLTERRALLTRVQVVTVVALALNAGLAVVMYSVDITTVVRDLFWSSSIPAGESATGEYAVATGRIGGVFNSPLAAGSAYSIGLLSLAHLGFTRRLTGSRLLVLGAAMLVGGVLCQSKVFLFAGLPAAVLLLLVNTGRVKRFTQVGVLGAMVFLWLRTTEWWATSGSLLAERFFLAGGADPLGFYTAGRYGDTSVVVGVSEQVHDTALWGGYGATNTLGPLDTGYLELLARAGLIGVALGVAFFLVLVAAAWRRRFVMPRMSWWTLVGMLVVAAAAVAGGPSVTQNRAGTLLLLGVMTLLLTWEPAGTRQTAVPVASRQTVPSE